MPVINYGLFTNEIIFDYPLHDLDVKFILEMLEETARDIFVNKLCCETGFIKDEYKIKPEEINIENAHSKASVEVKEISHGKPEFELDFGKCAVLSSGGKESLLTYALLNEIGCEVYPLFFNESGRHWYTALTAYRYFKQNVPRTKRVWSNVDRFYNFMLRNMKIIVPNFQRIKADIYPIRLFTFEHYVFSFLPLLYKYRIGNILLGNEYDDPTELSYDLKGIPHQYGVYDQSQPFDKYMTRWFMERGFNFRQWSVIRPVKGFVVEKILNERYPNLPRLQRSCHSTYIKDRSILPCGDCAKCSRIILFLLALGVDPKIMGYEDKHVKLFLKKVVSGIPHMGLSELEHCLYLINKRYGWSIPNAVLHPEVEMIHFDDGNSHFDAIPPEHRGKIYDVLERYAKGYVYLNQGKWLRISRDQAFRVFH